MWTHSPEAALEIAAGLHGERIARAEQLRLARRSPQNRTAAATLARPQPLSYLIGRITSAASTIRRGGADAGTSVPCPTGC